MRMKYVLSLYVPVAIMSILFCLSTSFARNDEYNEVTKAIQEKNARWSANETSVSKLNTEERRMQLGSQLPLPTGKERIMAAPLISPPIKLDWRNYNGNSYVTPIKEQGVCGACWAFATTAALESNILISQNPRHSP